MMRLRKSAFVEDFVRGAGEKRGTGRGTARIEVRMSQSQSSSFPSQYPPPLSVAAARQFSPKHAPVHLMLSSSSNFNPPSSVLLSCFFGSGTRAFAPSFFHLPPLPPCPGRRGGRVRDGDRDEAARARRGSWWGSRGQGVGGGNVVVGVVCERETARDDADAQSTGRGSIDRSQSRTAISVRSIWVWIAQFAQRPTPSLPFALAQARHVSPQPQQHKEQLNTRSQAEIHMH
ncbi:hypothetical protein EDB84DRAFT_625116 [Lactarius hengduanensis]|nr:hypothetical protein EDB84DRAFT_625116 [Lactarius hengduanensis]